MKERPKHWMLNIHCTKELIESAERQKSSNCMVADSIKSAAKVAGAVISNVQVDKQSIRLDMNGKRRVWWTPPRIAKEIQRFENGYHVKPFSFALQGGRELQITEVPPLRKINKSAPMRAARSVAAQKAAKTRKANRAAVRGQMETRLVTRRSRTGKPVRRVDSIRVREVGGAPFPRIRNGHRRVFGYRGLTLEQFGPEYEAWVRGEVDRRVASALKK
jgi:hypothetical protein